jgi:hypothetical protein
MMASEMNNIFNYRLRQAPRSVKSFVLAYLLTLTIAYIYAIANIYLVVGLTPKEVALHYYGSQEQKIESSSPEGEQFVDLDKLAEPNNIQPAPSLKNLVAEGHFHLFGMSSFFFCLVLLSLFTALPEKYKIPLVIIPFVSIVVDNFSFMATRFAGPQFAYLTVVSGGLMGLSFIILWFVILWEVLAKSKSDAT